MAGGVSHACKWTTLKVLMKVYILANVCVQPSRKPLHVAHGRALNCHIQLAQLLYCTVVIKAFVHLTYLCYVHEPVLSLHKDLKLQVQNANAVTKLTCTTNNEGEGY